jgi:hypothetical protein
MIEIDARKLADRQEHQEASGREAKETGETDTVRNDQR